MYGTIIGRSGSEMYVFMPNASAFVVPDVRRDVL